MRRTVIFGLIVAAWKMILPTQYLYAADQPLRSQMARPAGPLSTNQNVEVLDEGKTFHRPGCRYLHQRQGTTVKEIPSSEAIKEGYTPCIRCDPIQ